MARVIVDEFLRTKLNGLNAEVEFCDESGRTLCHFVPEEMFMKMAYAWLNCQVTDAELDEADREPGGQTLAEIWKSLGRI